jgi:DNA invertase Pin-like site-specific DNA recombinase
MNTTKSESTIPLTTGIETKPSVAYAYSRFSTVQQATGNSKQRQENFAANWPDAKKYEIKYLHDAGVSAYTGKNRTIGQFGVYLGMLRSGRLGPKPVLLVENFDRISREELETAQSLFLEIIGLGATIITLHNGKRYAKGMTLVDIITALVEMDVAHQHSSKLSMRVRKAIADRKKLGGIIHNRASAPSWLALDPKRTAFVQIPERVDIVKKIFDFALKGMGPVAITRFLNSTNVAVWSRRKKPPVGWRAQAVDNILNGRSVLGEFEGRAEYFGPGVISIDVWNAVNSTVRRKAQGRGNGVIRESNLFCGLLVSGIDGSTMIMRQSGVKNKVTGIYGWNVYLVSNLTIAGKSVIGHRVRYDLVESRILWLIKNLDPAMLSRARQGAHSDTKDRVAEAERQVETLEKMRLKYKFLIRADPEPSPTLVADLKEYEAQLTNATEELAQIKLESEKVVSVPSIPDDLSLPETRRAVRAEISQWCQNIEMRKECLIVWFSPHHGIAVSLGKEPVAYPYDLDNEERVTEDDIPEIESMENVVESLDLPKIESHAKLILVN